MARFLFDLRFALRSLTRSPLFALVAVASLALGIGANTAIFTLIDQLMLRLLPVAQPEQLVMSWTTWPHIGSNRGPRMASYPDRKSTRLNSSHLVISYAVFCLKKKK